MNRLIFLLVCLFCPVILIAEVVTLDHTSSLPSDPKKLYIDLIKKVVANTVYEDSDTNNNRYNAYSRENGKDWPGLAHTMVGMKRLNNIQYCMEQILENNIPGDCIETGVWRGGSTILMRAILQAYGDTDRKVWVADSFAGLPAPNAVKYPKDKGDILYKYDFLAVPLEQVQSNFNKYELLDNQVVFLKGLFSDSLPEAPIKELALLRLDGDLYESTMDALVNLYPKLSVGGFIIVDDFGAISACASAVGDYRKQNNIREPMYEIDWTGVYWQKK